MKGDIGAPGYTPDPDHNDHSMTATVVDRSVGGHSYTGVHLKTITISAQCPQCGQRRGEPYPYRFCEDGEWYVVSKWDNPCGHLDSYDAALQEAKNRAAPPEPRRECATCGAVRPLREMVSIVDPDTDQDAWHCRDCVKDRKASTGIDPLDAWLGSVLDANVKAQQKRKEGTA